MLQLFSFLVKNPVISCLYKFPTSVDTWLIHWVTITLINDIPWASPILIVIPLISTLNPHKKKKKKKQLSRLIPLKSPLKYVFWWLFPLNMLHFLLSILILEDLPISSPGPLILSCRPTGVSGWWLDGPALFGPCAWNLVCQWHINGTPYIIYIYNV